jgi:hypothetical protein
MIPPDEKARELLFEYYSLIPANTISNAKKCAIKAVDEILETIQEVFVPLTANVNSTYRYWQEVKQEIEKL